MENPYKENQFTVLNISSLTTKEEIINRVKELTGKIFLGEIPELTKEQVIKAKQKLLDTEGRLREELFYNNPDSLFTQLLDSLLKLWKENFYNTIFISDLANKKDKKDFIESDFSHPAIPTLPLHTDGSVFDTSPGDSIQGIDELPYPGFDIDIQ